MKLRVIKLMKKSKIKSKERKKEKRRRRNPNQFFRAYLY